MHHSASNPFTQGETHDTGLANCDIDATYQRLLALGATELDPVAEVGGGIKVAAVRDPFGNRLGLIDNPHFNPGDVR